MDAKLKIAGVFGSEQELRQTIPDRRICYDIEPYYNPAKDGHLLRTGYQINIYGTFPVSGIRQTYLACCRRL